MAYAEKRGKGPYPWRVKFTPPGCPEDSKSGFRTQDEALEYGRAQEVDGRRGVYIDPRKGTVTVAELAELWLESIDLRATSMRDYRSRLNAHILPRWGETEIGAITGMAVRAWKKDLRKQGLSQGHVDNIAMVLSMMLDDAAAERMITANPIQRKSRRGKFQSKRKKAEAERPWATDRQVLAIADNARTIRGLMGYAIVMTIAYTGMRIGEIAALRIEDCHLLTKRHEQWLDVQWQMQYEDGVYTRIECKYDSGRRLVIPPFLADILAEVIASHDNRPTGRGRRRKDPDADKWVFRAPMGGQLIIAGTWYETSWQRFVFGQEARPSSRGHKAVPAVPAVPGIDELDPHGLRHGHRVWLDEDDIPHVAIEARMGHEIRESRGFAVSSVARTYSHVTPAMERRVSEVLQARWERSQLPVAGGAGDAAAASS